MEQPVSGAVPEKLKQRAEFADLLALSSSELKEEIYFAWRLGVHVH
jgi:hypothetical protein